MWCHLNSEHGDHWWKDGYGALHQCSGRAAPETDAHQCYLRMTEIAGRLSSYGVPGDHAVLDFIRELIESLVAAEETGDRYQKRIRELEAALESRSRAIHNRFTETEEHSGWWAVCQVLPCHDDRALLG